MFYNLDDKSRSPFLLFGVSFAKRADCFRRLKSNRQIEKCPIELLETGIVLSIQYCGTRIWCGC